MRQQECRVRCCWRRTGIAMINPANGNTKPLFVGQGDQIFYE
ncbi:hypothetical protein LZT38_00095 [Escherichia coli]|nr:hypothetical protein LZT38_00095 [Escherichia coli]